MNLNDYLYFTNTTAIYPGAGEAGEIELNYLALGLASEAGEVAGKFKKRIRDGDISAREIASELGDVMWYWIRLCKAIGYTPEQVVQMNVEKLSSRSQRNVLRGSGDER